MSSTRLSLQPQDPRDHAGCVHESPRERYDILREIGRGGMGLVHQAYDRKLRRLVALKRDRGSHDRAGRDALHREALALARVRDSRVLTIYDYCVAVDGHYLALEYVHGVSLHRWQTRARRSRREILRNYIAAGYGLLAVHRAGLVHRDVKPHNILVGHDRSVKLADFGLAFAPGFAEDRTAGTPTYMAPEQLRGEPLDERADQFGLCVALHQALYDTHPFAPDNQRFEPTSQAELDVLIGHLVARAAPRCPPGCDHDPVWQVLVRGLDPAPEDRYPSMRELLIDLQACSRV